MATSPIEHLSGLVIGVVESVAPDQVRVMLELDTPHTTALNTGSPVAFPRLNGYVLIPHEAGATVAYISWMGIERSPFPKRSGLKDFGLIDLPFPLRKMAVSPVATLTCKRDTSSRTQYELARGVVAFPSVGDQVLIPTAEQIEAIVGAKDSDRRVRIGVSPLGTNAKIMVDPNKLFGRHLAVLGNTGSGKSCTVAGLIRWSIDAANAEIAKAGKTDAPNARFIILDPNGEYTAAFRDQPDKVRIFKVAPTGVERPLDVPAWAMNGHEWTAISNAQPGAQRPLLMQGLRDLKHGDPAAAPGTNYIRSYVYSYAVQMSAMLQAGPNAFAGDWKVRTDCGNRLDRMSDDILSWCALFDGDQKVVFETARKKIADVVQDRRNGKYFLDFGVAQIESIVQCLNDCVATFPEAPPPTQQSEDVPCPFDVSFLANHLERIAVEQGAGIAAFVSTLGLRIRSMLSDANLNAVINRDPPVAFESWLSDYVGADQASNGHLAIIDLSLVPSEVIHIVVAVLGRLVFESLQRYRRANVEGMTLPTVLVLEEAHTFVRRGNENADGAQSATALCRETFERIAREGRKFGLGLVISSQRPSELSPTVLAQCNTFILHRIVNDSDQVLVGKLVPDNVAGLLAELPSLPSRQAVLLGWATPIPVLVEIDELPHLHRPHSADPDFWDVWTKNKSRDVDWSAIAQEWGWRPPASPVTAPAPAPAGPPIPPSALVEPHRVD